MQITKITKIPKRLQQLADPPKQLYVAGANLNNLLKGPCLAVVGSRNPTPYGQQITTQLVSACAAAGITIISGLAYGVDSLAHRAALNSGGKTIAVLPASLKYIYPRGHQRLAQQILEQGGALVSEYSGPGAPQKYRFIARNRIIAGLAQATLITEAGAKSGSLHTAQFALELGREVLAVPGNITSPLSAGTNQLLRDGARQVTSPTDILELFNLKLMKLAQNNYGGHSSAEQTLLRLLQRGASQTDDLLNQSKLTPAIFNQTLTGLQLADLIKPLSPGHWGLVALNPALR